MCHFTLCHFTKLREKLRLVVLPLIAALVIGCGGDSSSPVEVAGAAPSSSTSPAKEIPPVAAISSSDSAAMEPTASRIVAEPGSPEALLMRIAELVAAANSDARRQQAGEENGQPDTQAEQAYHQRLKQVIELATQVIAATHLDPAAEQSFNNAVHYLSDARLELASTGDAEQAKLLLEDADSLYERDKDSFAAAEANSKVVELAQRMARSLGGNDSEWLSEYVTQTKRFADRFPSEPSRAAMGLFTAGRLCDRFGQTNLARNCLEQVQTQFAGTVFAEQSAGILRRLSLRGQPLELTGPTIDGGFVDIEHYQKQAVLVVFWATTSPTFLEQLPIVKQVEAEFGGQNFSIIGVNLDKHEAAVDAFLTKHNIAWPQVFSADPDQRAGRNPVARYYGVQVLPTYWLVAPGGIVASERVEIESLRESLAALIHNR